MTALQLSGVSDNSGRATEGTEALSFRFLRSVHFLGAHVNISPGGIISRFLFPYYLASFSIRTDL